MHLCQDFFEVILRGESLEKSANYANASGALVVSRHGCAPAIPGEEELLLLSRKC